MKMVGRTRFLVRDNEGENQQTSTTRIHYDTTSGVGEDNFSSSSSSLSPTSTFVVFSRRSSRFFSHRAMVSTITRVRIPTSTTPPITTRIATTHTP